MGRKIDVRNHGPKIHYSGSFPQDWRRAIFSIAPSALSRLKCRVGKFRRIGHAAWHKEVCHAEVVRGAADGSRTGGASECCQEAEGNGPESSACSDSAEGRR